MAICIPLLVATLGFGLLRNSPREVFATSVVSALCIAICLACYAPWTFFVVIRALGAFTVGGCVLYLLDEIRRGRWTTEGTGNQSVMQAVCALLTFGIPGAYLMLKRIPKDCPYDETGRALIVDVERVVRVPIADPAKNPIEALKRLSPSRIVLMKSGRGARLDWITEGGEQLMRVSVPVGEDGEKAWLEWSAQLADAGIAFEVIREGPGRRTFRKDVFWVFARST